MNSKIIIFCGILPAILLVFYIYLRDRYQREPLGQILKAVFYGVISAGIAIVLESSLKSIGMLIDQPATWIGALWNAFVGAAMPEELAKLLMLWLLLRRNKYFDERFDGIVYACCIGMGFAGTENVLYLFGNIENWQSVAVSRAIFAVPGHFMFAVAMGYFYSKIHFRDMSWSYRAQVFLAPVILHGTYDGLLFMANVTPEMAGLILMAFYLFCFWMFRISRRSIQIQSKASDPNNLIFRVK